MTVTSLTLLTHVRIAQPNQTVGKSVQGCQVTSNSLQIWILYVMLLIYEGGTSINEHLVRLQNLYQIPNSECIASYNQSFHGSWIQGREHYIKSFQFGGERWCVDCEGAGRPSFLQCLRYCVLYMRFA